MLAATGNCTHNYCALSHKYQKRVIHITLASEKGTGVSARNIVESERRNAIGQRIREWRRRRKLSQASVALASHITQASLSNYENGKRDLPVTTLLHVAKALNVPLGELIETSDIIVVRDSSLGSAITTLTQRPDLVSIVTNGATVTSIVS